MSMCMYVMRVYVRVCELGLCIEKKQAAGPHPQTTQPNIAPAMISTSSIASRLTTTCRV